jgi:hypothetical protein
MSCLQCLCLFAHSDVQHILCCVFILFSSGGICEKFRPFLEGGQQVNMSLNTGIVTLINYGDDVAPRVSQLTFARLVYNVCVCLRIVMSNTYCAVFLFCFPSSCFPMLLISLDCPFLIAPSVFSNVYLPVSLDCLFLLPLRYSTNIVNKTFVDIGCITV